MSNGQALPRVDSVSNISWRAIFGGTAITLVVVMMLVLLGIAVGMFSVDPATEENPFGGLGTGSAIWWVLSWIIALFFGGWVTSRFAGLQRKFDGVLHGLVTWSITFLVSLFFLTNVIGTVVGGTFSIMQNVMSAAGQAVSVVAPSVSEALTGEDPLKAVMQQGQKVLDEIRQRGGERAVSELTDALRQIFQQPEVTQADRQRIRDILLEYTDMSEQEARRTVDQWVSSYEQARQEIQQMQEQLPKRAEQISDALGQAAIWSFIALLLGALAAGLGGMVGRVKGVVSV
ncbi:MAG: hypothetical protein ACLFQR_02585 [Desulfovibrionales bacterium]